MDETVVFGVIFMTFFILVTLIIKLARFIRRFTEKTHRICREMDRTDSDAEYRLRRCELRCHYLTLIPFINEKNVMRLYNLIFRKKDSENTKERKDSLVPLLLPSVLGVCICVFCLCGMTWAWYSASVETPTQKISAACFEVTVESVFEVEGDKNKKVEPESGSSYKLKADTTYTIALLAKGSVKECGGYCLIECGDIKQYTQTFKPGDTIEITLTPEMDGVYTFTGVWGSIPSAVVKEKIIKSNAENAEDADVSTAYETTAEPIDSSEPPIYETTAEDPVIPAPESTASQDTTPAESNTTPVVPSDPIPSDPPVTEPAPDSATVTDSFAVTEEPTDFDTDSSVSDEHVSEEEKAMGEI